MLTYYFDLITFSFDDGTSIEISHVESDVRISMRLKTKKVYADFSQIREDSELARTKMKFILSKESYRKLEDDRWMHRVTGEILQTEDLLEMYKDVYPHLEDLNIHGYPSWLDTIVKSVHIEMIGTKRLQTVDYPEREGISRVSWRIGNTVKVYAKDFAKQLAKARAEASKVAAELDRTYPSRIISSFEKYQEKQTIANLNKNLRILNSKREILMKLGLMDEAKDEVLSRSIILNDKITVALNIYLEDSSKKLEAYDDMVKKVNLFFDLINHRFLDKKISVEGEEGLVIRSTKTNDKIELNGLSSGEQHLFVLYYYLLFKYKENTLLLMDEPEISLHITWQKRFINDLMRIVEINPMKVLIATHSPSIVRDYWSVTQELTPIEG